VIRLEMGMEAGNVTPAEEKVSQILRKEFDEEPSRDFQTNLEILREKLSDKSSPIGVLIDNLQPALDANFRFLEKLRGYEDLLRILGDRDVCSFTLITSRKPLIVQRVKVHEYSLKGLDIVAWREYFHDCKNGTTSEDLAQMCVAYNGNAKAMGILHGAIINRFDSNIAAYWNRYKDTLLADEELKNLISVEMDCLRDDQPDAYKLLCRMGCYRYQDVKTVPFEGLICLLWDVPEARQTWVVDYLSKSSLIEIKGEYYLHPAIRESAKLRLQNNLTDWKKSNQQAASYLKDEIKSITAQFEAIEHLFSINDVQGVVSVLLNDILGAEKLDNIRCSSNLWNNVIPILRIVEKARNYENMITSDDLALVLTILGLLYSEVGANIKALKTAEEMLKICERLINKSSEKLKFAHLSSYMIQGRAYRLLGNYDKSETFCQKASKYGQDSKNSMWKGFGLYELALTKLETKEPRKALNCIVVAAFISSGIPGIPNGIKKLLFEPIESVGKKLSKLVTKHEKSDDRTKKFGILYNTAKALNRIAKSNDIPQVLIAFRLQNKIYNLAKIVLDLAEKYVNEEDKGTPVYLYLEYAEYYRNIEDGDKAESYYQKILGLFSTMPTICQAMYKRSYCQFKYELGEDEATLAECKQAEVLLNETEFYYWTLDNYLMIMELLAKRINDTNAAEAEIANYYRKAQDLCEKIGDPKEFNLNRVNQAFEQGAKQ